MNKHFDFSLIILNFDPTVFHNSWPLSEKL